MNNNQETRGIAQEVVARSTSYNMRRLANIIIQLLDRVEKLEQQVAQRRPS